jgi:Methyltransferase domain
LGDNLSRIFHGAAMMRKSAVRVVLMSAFVALCGVILPAQSAQTTKPFEPTVGQAGKDVVWVPTDQRLVDKMLEMAKVTPQDYLMDLGSGDGRTVITAAKRGLRAQGIEYNPDMVDLAKKNAAAAGVTDKATFLKADIFETDYSKATVITLFLLPQLNLKLRPTILNMKPGTRIVSNSFDMGDWPADQTETLQNCSNSFCTAMLWIVPAKVAGNWQVGSNTLTLDQSFQTVSGRLGSNVLSDGKLNGTDITFTVGGQKYTGKVDGNAMSGTIAGGGNWTASKR